MNRNLINLDATIVCTHLSGKVTVVANQTWVRAEAAPLLSSPDPVGRTIVGCPNVALAKPCTVTFAPRRGYSDLVRIDGKPVVVDHLVGATDGDGGIYEYKVKRPGQTLVNEVSS